MTQLPPDEDDFHIYSPESTDGYTDWPSIIVSVALALLFLALLVAGLNWALMPSSPPS